jgi:hypothetical protein
MCSKFKSRVRVGTEILRIEMRVGLGGSRSLVFWFDALEF